MMAGRCALCICRAATAFNDFPKAKATEMLLVRAREYETIWPSERGRTTHRLSAPGVEWKPARRWALGHGYNRRSEFRPTTSCAEIRGTIVSQKPLGNEGSVVSIGHGGMENTGIFPISPRGQRNGRRVPIPSGRVLHPLLKSA